MPTILFSFHESPLLVLWEIASSLSKHGKIHWHTIYGPTHYSDVIMSVMASQITSLNRLFRRRSKKISKFRAPSLCEGNSLVTGSIPRTKGKWGGKCFHLMTSSWNILFVLLALNKILLILINIQTQIRDNNLNIYINNVQVNETNCTKDLGLFIDNTLSWDMQCDKSCRHISGKVAVLRRIRSFIKPSIMKLIYDRTIQPVIDYGCSVWYDTTCKNLEKLQKVQNHAARIISGNFDY